MASQYFLGVEQALDILFQEIPDGPYPKDRADDVDPNKRSWSSSELRAHAQLFGNLYGNLRDIYSDKFASTVTPAGLVRWEQDYFTEAQDQSQSFAVRQQNLINQIRAIGGLNYPSLYDLVNTILAPAGLTFDLVAYCGMNNGAGYGAWILELSSLDFDTYLSALDPLIGSPQDNILTPLDCDLDYAAAGLTAQDLADIQLTAYGYEVRIYGNASPEILSRLDKQLTLREPARSQHFIRNNALMP
jgi:hypothetical protein